MRDLIIRLIDIDLVRLEEKYLNWFEGHRIDPVEVSLFTSFNCTEKRKYWLVTNHKKNSESNYRIIFDGREKKFGLEMETESGENVMMGLYGSFFETIRSM
ncbi:MAG: hypothetical protein CME70_03710 [Halobacteriovorax sp.]|nr:hypothetical protein [Halobacteriovorax sp.]|tara:strand:+ start:187011 stop:187313 length:303 start_codon:yes stop_codon:yes gene_type:complete